MCGDRRRAAGSRDLAEHADSGTFLAVGGHVRGLCTGLAYFLYYRLLYRIGAPRTSTVTYLVPLFGVIWAWVFLGEPLTVSMAIAGALILGGVALSQQRAPARKPTQRIE